VGSDDILRRSGRQIVVTSGGGLRSSDWQCVLSPYGSGGGLGSGGGVLRGDNEQGR
jgi:hypothetical protein